MISRASGAIAVRTICDPARGSAPQAARTVTISLSDPLRQSELGLTRSARRSLLGELSMTRETNNIFISHINEDDEKLADMKSLLETGGFRVRDSSINSTNPNEAHNPDYIKSGILTPRIRWAGVLVVLISPETRNSEWVNWEIEYANKLGKRIVGVWAHGANECDVPDALDLYADAVVGWQAERVKDAIGGKINNWETSGGVLRPERAIARHAC
jgi:hypothetical protein